MGSLRRFAAGDRKADPDQYGSARDHGDHEGKHPGWSVYKNILMQVLPYRIDDKGARYIAGKHNTPQPCSNRPVHSMLRIQRHPCGIINAIFMNSLYRRFFLYLDVSG